MTGPLWRKMRPSLTTMGFLVSFEEEGSREDDSTNVEAEVQRGEEEFMSMFTNGLGANDQQAGSFTR
jgi:hypothetical protein